MQNHWNFTRPQRRSGGLLIFASIAAASILLHGCSPISYRGSNATPPSFAPALTNAQTAARIQPAIQSASASAAASAPAFSQTPGRTFSTKSRVPSPRPTSGITEFLFNPFRDLFDGRGDRTRPPGTRGSASYSWSDTGDGKAPTHWRPVAFSALPGWQNDAHAEALFAFGRSCARITKRDGNAPMGSMSYGGFTRQWQELCNAGAQVPGNNNLASRQFFETHFQPYYIPGPGKFTGYYEASLNGSRVRGGAYQWPLYRKPQGANAALAGQTRQQIDAGGLANRGLELLWIDNPVDIFLLHIQGSGVVTLPNGQQIRVGYAGNNGKQFKGIRPALEQNGYDVSANGLTIQAYRNWLLAQPTDVSRRVMNYNPRFIYFDINDAPSARGDGGTLLTAQRSMAVDKSIIPLHTPLWVTTNVPGPSGQGQVDVARVMIAQDTGTAIKGEIRGDFYWGHGAEAFARAGRMWGKGRYHVLLPKFIPLR